MRHKDTEDVPKCAPLPCAQLLPPDEFPGNCIAGSKGVGVYKPGQANVLLSKASNCGGIDLIRFALPVESPSYHELHPEVKLGY